MGGIATAAVVRCIEFVFGQISGMPPQCVATECDKRSHFIVIDLKQISGDMAAVFSVQGRDDIAVVQGVCGK